MEALKADLIALWGGDDAARELVLTMSLAEIRRALDRAQPRPEVLPPLPAPGF